MYEELVDEDFGGDEKEDFADEIESDKDEIEADEIYDDEEVDDEAALDDEGFEDEEGGEEEIEDRVEDLEARFAELSAEFEALVGDEEGLEDEGFEDEGEEGFEDEGDFGDEDEFAADDEGFEEEDFDDLEEATKLQDEVPSPGMDKEGKFSGTGKNSKIGATNVNAPFSRPTRKADHGGKPVQAKGGDESGFKAGQGKESTPSDNIDAPQKKQTAKSDGFAGTDKGSKKGAVNPKSPLGSAGSPKGAS